MSFQMQSSDFLNIKDESSRFMLENAYQAITISEGWDFMKSFNDNQNGFMFSSNPMTGKIMSKMDELGYSGHSGFSFGWTMRMMEFLAKNGREAFLAKFQ
jgi:hypothetical protein